MASPSRAAYLALCAVIAAILLTNSATAFQICELISPGKCAARKLARDRTRAPRRARPGSSAPTPAPVPAPVAASCGNEDQQCCEAAACNDSDGHLVCVADAAAALSICITCGNEGAPICEIEGEPACNRHLVASDGKCGEPAVAGENCCTEGFSCCGDGCIPSEDLAITLCPAEGTCGCDSDASAPIPTPVLSSCGNEDQQCCDGGACNDSDGHLVCVADDEDVAAICITCGNEGTPICEIEGEPACNRHLVATDGKCGEPPVAGENCCQDGFSCCGTLCIPSEDLAFRSCPVASTCGCA